MKIAIYSRKSIFTGKGESIENQIKLCKEYCDAYFKNQKIEYVIYEDEGFSGKNIKRPQFQNLLNDVKAKQINMLICYRLDRISRNVADFSSILELLEKYNVDFISINERFDTSTPTGRAMVYISSVFAQLERETIAERVKDNMIQLAKMGKWSGGQLPLGYTSEKVHYMNEEMKEKTFIKLVPIDYELDTIRFIYNNFLTKGSILNVTKELNSHGYKTKTGVNFEITGVKRILRSALYVKSSESVHEYLKAKKYNVFGKANGNGYLGYNKRTDKDNIIIAVSNHKGVISSTDWLSVQKKLDANIEKSKETSNRNGTGCNDTLFSGLLKCGKCGSNMVIKYNGKNKDGISYIYYTCSNKDKKYLTNRCDIPNLRSDLVDPIIVNNIKIYNKDILIKEYKNKLSELLKNSDKQIINDLKSQINDKEKQARNLVTELSKTESEDVKVLYRSQIDEITKEINKLKSIISSSEETQLQLKDAIMNIKHLIQSFIDFNNYFDNAIDINIKRTLLRNIVEKVTYDADKKDFNVKFFRIDNMQLDGASEHSNTLTAYKINILELGDTIGEKLKYYRLKNNLTQDKLAKIIGYYAGSCIKDLELNRKLPRRNFSKNLASYFNLDTKYFFDNYLEDTDNIKDVLKNYRKKYNFSIKQASNKFGIGQTVWTNWESGKTYPDRARYNLLKEHNIL